MEEIWKGLPGWEELYEISNYGNIKSLDRVDKRGVFHKSQTMKTYTSPNGREYFTFVYNGKTYTDTVWKYVVLAFPEICGEWFEGCEIHHKDFDKTNNKAQNLVVMSRREHKQLHNPPKDKWSWWKKQYLN